MEPLHGHIRLTCVSTYTETLFGENHMPSIAKQSRNKSLWFLADVLYRLNSWSILLWFGIWGFLVSVMGPTRLSGLIRDSVSRIDHIKETISSIFTPGSQEDVDSSQEGVKGEEGDHWGEQREPEGQVGWFWGGEERRWEFPEKRLKEKRSAYGMFVGVQRGFSSRSACRCAVKMMSSSCLFSD